MSDIEQAVDLTALLPQDMTVLHIVTPGGSARTGWEITLAGPGHPKTVDFNAQQERKRIDRAKRIEMAQVNGRKWKGDDEDDAGGRREFVAGLVARIVTWTPVRIGNETIPFTEAGATELLMRPQMGQFVSQIVERLVDERAFMTASDKT